MSAFGGKADIAATPLRKPLIAGARRQPLAQSWSGVCSTLRARRPKRRSRSLSAARKVRMPPLSCSVCDVRAALGRGYANSAARNFARADTIRSVRPRAVDHFLERNVFFALGAADQAHLLEVVLGLEEVALFGMPHAVIGPGQSVFGIGGKRLVVPIFGVVIAAQLAARIAEQRRYVGIVVVLQGAERGDAALIIVFVVNQCISGMITVDEVLGRAGFIFLVFLGLAGRLLRGPLRAPSRVPSHTTGAAATHRGSKLRGARDSRRKDDGCKHRNFAHGSSGFGWLERVCVSS